MIKFVSCLVGIAFFLADFGLAADLDGAPAKTATPPNKTTEELNSEAELRISGFKLPKDISASLFVDSNQTQNPTAICFDDKGRLYIAEVHRWRAGVQDIRNEQQLLFDDLDNRTSEDRRAMYARDTTSHPPSFYTDYEDRIVILEDTDGDGRADKKSVFSDGFNDTLDGPGIGLVHLNDSIYYTNIPHLWKLTDADGDGKAEKKESLQDGFGVRMSISGHDMHGAIVGPDGKIYWSIGDRGYHITTKEGRHYDRPMEGGVFSCDPDGSNLEEIYRGLRNPQELAFDKYGNLFTCDNDADQWDKGRLVYIIEGGNSGWNAGHQALINFRDQLGVRTPNYNHPKHKKIPMNPWMTEGIWDPNYEGRPEFALPAVSILSWGPSGLVYNYGVVAMPERYDNHFWICNFGGANGDLEAFSVKEKGAGFALDHQEKFMTGLGNTDVEFGPDGRMYLSCFNNSGWYKQDLGNVYVLEEKVHSNANIAAVEELLLSDFSTKSVEELGNAMLSKDMRVRQKAQFQLVVQNNVDDLNNFAKGAKSIPGDHDADQIQLSRLHGIWGLGQLARKDESLLDHLILLLKDPDAEVRAQVAKVLADSRTEKAGTALMAALDDESDRVKSFAAIGVGKCRNVAALPKLQEIIIANNNEDLFLRHACIQGMWYLNEREKILKLVDHESPALRIAVLLTLRKLEDPRVKYFLEDSDKTIRYAAIRAINDLDLVTAWPDLAKQIEPFALASDSVEMPEGHQDWIIQTRLINANFRVGTAECAQRLITYAAQPKLPEILRQQALAALEEWSEPTVIDPTVGIHRPLDPATRLDIGPVVKEHLSKVFDTAEGSLIAAATQVALKYEAPAPVELLVAELKNPEAETESRIGAIRGLTKQKPEALDPLWNELLANEEAAVRAETATSLITVKPDEGLENILKMADSENLQDRQAAYRILATVDSPRAATLIAARLGSIKSEKPGAKLDLIEAAENRSEDSVKTALGEYQKSLGDDPLASFDVAMAGGDSDAGKTIFSTHAAGQCAKCHMIGGDGGVAGPDLSDIGKRHDATYLLESLINPSAVVIPGYGMTMMTLKNGESVGGALLSEDDTSVILKIPDPEDTTKQNEKTFAKAGITSRTPPVSAMPPMNYLMTKSEIRDLVAYLGTLKTSPKK